MDEHDHIARPRIDPTTTPFLETQAFRRYGLTDDPDPFSPESLYVKAVIQEQGFDGLPHLVSRRELDRYVAGGEVELFRGVSEARFAEQLRTGDFFVGRGWFADGMYTAPGPGGIAIARRYAPPGVGAIVRMSLRRGALVVRGDELERRAASARDRVTERLQAERRRLPSATHGREDDTAVLRRAEEYDRRIEVTRALYNDLARWAAYVGYDAIQVVVPDFDYIVVLNRTALRIQLEDIR
jgi:hypothetical protein